MSVWTWGCIGEAAGDAGSDLSELWRACSAYSIQVLWVLGCLQRTWAEVGGGPEAEG